MPYQKKYIHKFDSWGEFIGRVRQPVRLKPHDHVSTKPDHGTPMGLAQLIALLNNTPSPYQDSSWYDSKTYDEAISFLEKGWDDGLQQLEAIIKTIPSNIFDSIMPVQDYKPESVHQMAGGTVDVVEHIVGASPLTFVGEQVSDNAEQIVKGRKLKTLYIQIHGDAGVSKQGFMFRGAYNFALIEHLENCGYSVEVWAFDPSTRGLNGAFVQTTYVKVKEFGELLDKNKIAIALASRFMARRFLFALQECYPMEEQERLGDSYGRCATVEFDDILLPEDRDINPLFVNITCDSNPDSIKTKFLKVLEDHVNNDK